jgi:hypothetical protein
MVHRWRSWYCGVFMPCKNRNLITCSCNYATVDETVFSLYRAELRRVVPPPTPRIASSRSLPGNSYKHLGDARVGMGHMTESAVMSRVSIVLHNRSTFGRSVSRVSDQGFIGETEVRLQWLSVGDNRGRFVVGEDLILWLEVIDFSWVWEFRVLGWEWEL